MPGTHIQMGGGGSSPSPEPEITISRVLKPVLLANDTAEKPIDCLINQEPFQNTKLLNSYTGDDNTNVTLGPNHVALANQIPAGGIAYAAIFDPESQPHIEEIVFTMSFSDMAPLNPLEFGGWGDEPTPSALNDPIKVTITSEDDWDNDVTPSYYHLSFTTMGELLEFGEANIARDATSAAFTVTRKFNPPMALQSDSNVIRIEYPDTITAAEAAGRLAAGGADTLTMMIKYRATAPYTQDSKILS